MYDCMKGAVVAAAMTLGGAASAAVIDFTDTATWIDGSSTDAIFGSTVSLSATGGAITQNLAGAPGPVGPLLGLSDGLGVKNDEITMGETITVSFSKAVRVTGLFFLDLFNSLTGDGEIVTASFSGGEVVSSPALVDVTDTFGFGFNFFAPITTTSITFSIEGGNDGRGLPDFALAGIEVQPIPVPGSLVLLASAIIGASVLARRRATV